MFNAYRLWYESVLGMSITTWVRRDFQDQPMVYLAVIFTMGLLLGMLVGRWQRAMWLVLPLVVLIATLIGHIFTWE